MGNHFCVFCSAFRLRHASLISTWGIALSLSPCQSVRTPNMNKMLSLIAGAVRYTIRLRASRGHGVWRFTLSLWKTYLRSW